MPLPPPAHLADLVERLRAAASDADAYHHDLCQAARPEPGWPCSCGTPRLLRDLAEAIAPACRDV